MKYVQGTGLDTQYLLLYIIMLIGMLYLMYRFIYRPIIEYLTAKKDYYKSQTTKTHKDNRN